MAPAPDGRGCGCAAGMRVIVLSCLCTIRTRTSPWGAGQRASLVCVSQPSQVPAKFPSGTGKSGALISKRLISKARYYVLYLGHGHPRAGRRDGGHPGRWSNTE